MSKTVTTIVGLIIIMMVIIGFKYNERSDALSTDKPIKIGALVCLTGACASWGEGALMGMQLAVEEINAAGGVLGRPIELVIQDSREETVASAVSGYQYLRQNKIHYLVGPSWAPAGLALAPIASKDAVIMTSPSLGLPEFNEAGKNLFNLWPHDEDATKRLAQLAIAKGWKRAAVVSSRQAWEQTQGRVFADEFTRLGGIITMKIEPIETIRNLRTELLQLKNTQPDVVMFTNTIQMATAAKDLKHLGYIGQKMAVLMDQTRVDAAEGGFENTIFVQYPEASKTFVDAFSKKYNKKPFTAADTAYDVIYFYVQGLKQAGSDDMTKVQAALSAIKTFKGASGAFNLDSQGGVTKTSTFWTIRNSQFVKYEE